MTVSGISHSASFINDWTFFKTSSDVSLAVVGTPSSLIPILLKIFDMLLQNCNTRFQLSLLNKMPWVSRVSKCQSVWVPFNCPSAHVPKCPSGAWVPQVLECESDQVPCVSKCHWSSLGEPNFPLSALWVKKVCKIIRNGLLNSFIEFLKTFQNTYFTSFSPSVVINV